MYQRIFIFFVLLFLLGNYCFGQSKSENNFSYRWSESLLRGEHEVIEKKNVENGSLLITRKLHINNSSKKDSFSYYLFYENEEGQRDTLFKGFKHYKFNILDNISYNKSEQLIGWQFLMYQEGYYIKIYHKTSGGWQYLKKIILSYGYNFMKEDIDYRIINKDFIEYMLFVFREKNDSLYAYVDHENLFNIYEHTGKKWKKFKKENKRKIYNIQKLNSNVYHFKFNEEWLKKELDKIKIGYKIMNKNGRFSFLGPKEMNYDIRFDQLPEDLSKYDNEKGRKVINDFKNRIINDFIVELDSNKIIKAIYYRRKGFVLPKSKRIYQTPENL